MLAIFRVTSGSPGGRSTWILTLSGLVASWLAGTFPGPPFAPHPLSQASTPTSSKPGRNDRLFFIDIAASRVYHLPGLRQRSIEQEPRARKGHPSMSAIPTPCSHEARQTTRESGPLSQERRTEGEVSSRGPLASGH